MCQATDINAGLKGEPWSQGISVGLMQCTGSRGLGWGQRGCEGWGCVCILSPFDLESPTVLGETVTCASVT